MAAPFLLGECLCHVEGIVPLEEGSDMLVVRELLPCPPVEFLGDGYLPMMICGLVTAILQRVKELQGDTSNVR